MNETKYLLALFKFQCLPHCISELDNEVLSSWVNVFLKLLLWTVLFHICCLCRTCIFQSLLHTTIADRVFHRVSYHHFWNPPPPTAPPPIKTNTLSMRRPLHFKMKSPNWKPNATHWNVKAPSRKWFLKKNPKIANCH